MSFILLHQENGLCGYEASLINPTEVVAVMPIVGGNKWFVQQSNACVHLSNGLRMNVRETVDAIMGILHESGKMNILSHAVSELTRNARQIVAHTA